MSATTLRVRGDFVQIKIALLDGHLVDYPEKVKRDDLKVKDVIEFAHKESGIDDLSEARFFSLYSYENYKPERADGKELKQKIFLDCRKPSRCLKEHFYSKDEKMDSMWKFYYGVKFYVPNSEIELELRSEKARWLYYLQLCNDIQEKKILLTHISKNNCTTLNSLMLRAREAGVFAEQCPLMKLVLTEYQADDDKKTIDNAMIDKVEVASMDPSRAVKEFIKYVSELNPMYYGKHLFLAWARPQKKHKSTTEDLVIIANDRHGIAIYSDEELKEQILWKDIIKISYKRNDFRIKCLKTENGECDKRDVVVSLYFAGCTKVRPQQAKWMWKNALEQHAFPRLDHPRKYEVIFSRRTSFRYSGTDMSKHYVITKKEEIWKITDHPPSDMNLKDREIIKINVMQPKAATPVHQLHFEIRADNKGVHHLINHQQCEESGTTRPQ